MFKIEEINEDQQKKITEYVEGWEKSALSTTPIDEGKAIVAINALYENAGLERPRHILFLKSPTGCFLAKTGMEKLVKQKEMGTTERLWRTFQNQFWKIPHDNHRDAGRESISAEVTNLLEKHLCVGLPKDIGCEVGYNVWTSVLHDMNLCVSLRVGERTRRRIHDGFNRDAIRRTERDFFLKIVMERTLCNELDSRSKAGNLICGRHMSPNQLGIYEYCENELGIKYTETFKPLINVARECGSILPYTNVCFVSSRPKAIHLDGQYRLHKLGGGKALEYWDGWGIWAVNGVQMPEKYASEIPENWDSRWLLETSNAEHRRVIIGVIGYSKLMRQLGATQIHSDVDMSLHKIDLDVDVETIYFLKVRCPSTGASYALRVPPNVKTCEEARMTLMRNSKGNYTFVKET